MYQGTALAVPIGYLRHKRDRADAKERESVLK